ncbi:Hypothetical predicted protein [Paramuricea clavata]|uniref:Uncharacterized protein n=1 Tax=Paramuricea clavata TaxID=317549 RepID=A0A7D9HM67_PARCT|nr:Hypothetical predicted protein [Paramuricea clavata]
MLQFSDLSDLGQDGTGQSFIFENVVLWDFNILPSPPSQTIQPRDPDTVNEELDSVLSPINLQGQTGWQTGCNCDLQPINLQGQTGCNCDLQPINLQGQTVCNCDLQPINLQGQTGCNCDLQPINYVCLVDITPQYSIVDCEKWTMGQR